MFLGVRLVLQQWKANINTDASLESQPSKEVSYCPWSRKWQNMLLLFALCLSLSDVHHLHVFLSFLKYQMKDLKRKKKIKERVKQSMYQQSPSPAIFVFSLCYLFHNSILFVSRILFVFQSVSVGKTKICRWFVSE